MGRGKSYKCSKCGKEYSASWGCGYMFPLEYEELIKAIKKGKYGEEWKEVLLSDEYTVVDAETHVYLCRSCNHWTTAPGLSLYLPKDPSHAEKKACVIESDLKDDYKVLKRRIHRCEKCGSRMHRASNSELDKLPCPDCGGEPEEGSGGMILWD